MAYSADNEFADIVTVVQQNDRLSRDLTELQNALSQKTTLHEKSMQIMDEMSKQYSEATKVQMDRIRSLEEQLQERDNEALESAEEISSLKAYCTQLENTLSALLTPGHFHPAFKDLQDFMARDGQDSTCEGTADHLHHQLLIALEHAPVHNETRTTSFLCTALSELDALEAILDRMEPSMASILAQALAPPSPPSACSSDDASRRSRQPTARAGNRDAGPTARPP